MILVGGPAVNTLVEELASENKTWTADDYEEDTWVLDLVEGFSEDTHALVVAGYASQDTQAASNFISNYADNQDELAGETRVSMTTSASAQ
jgi:S-layer protein (TIGR01564 family)